MRWRSYGNGRDTGVSAYAVLPGAIALRFRDGRVYLYDADRPGRGHVACLLRLARRGTGLTTYVNRHVRNHYAGVIVT